MSEVNQSSNSASSTPCTCSAPQGQPAAAQPQTQPAANPAPAAPKAGKRAKKR